MQTQVASPLRGFRLSQEQSGVYIESASASDPIDSFFVAELALKVEKGRMDPMPEEAGRQEPLNSANSALRIIEGVKDDHMRKV